jgi:hypothetical protein
MEIISILVKDYFFRHAREGGHPEAFEKHRFPLSRE